MRRNGLFIAGAMPHSRAVIGCQHVAPEMMAGWPFRVTGVSINLTFSACVMSQGLSVASLFAYLGYTAIRVVLSTLD